jgi:peroxiredoxin
VAWTGSDAEFQGFIDKYGLSFPQLSDDAGVVYEHFGVPIQPAFALVDASGQVETLLGAVDEETLDRLLTDLTS